MPFNYNKNSGEFILALSDFSGMLNSRDIDSVLRDDFTCQECGFTEKQLNYTLPIHHIDYNKKNNNENNLIALCKSCHMQTNYDRNDWTDYLQQKINSINNRKRYQNE